MEIQFNVFVRLLQSENVKEYMSVLFQTYMIQQGILHQFSCVDPATNRVPKQKNQHLLETT